MPVIPDNPVISGSSNVVVSVISEPPLMLIVPFTTPSTVNVLAVFHSSAVIALP